MDGEPPKGGETLSDRLKSVERLEVELLREIAKLTEQNATIYKSDFFIFGAVRRALAQSKGFRQLVNSKNFPCAAGIIRMQIDTAMRLNAVILVEDVDVFWEELSDGTQFNRIIASDGNKLTDKYLRLKL